MELEDYRLFFFFQVLWFFSLETDVSVSVRAMSHEFGVTTDWSMVTFSHLIFNSPRSSIRPFSSLTSHRFFFPLVLLWLLYYSHLFVVFFFFFPNLQWKVSNDADIVVGVSCTEYPCEGDHQVSNMRQVLPQFVAIWVGQFISNQGERLTCPIITRMGENMQRIFQTEIWSVVFSSNERLPRVRSQTGLVIDHCTESGVCDCCNTCALRSLPLPGALFGRPTGRPQPTSLSLVPS